MGKDKRETAISILQVKQTEIGRRPKKGDFKPNEIGFIKSTLGPWPRALEAAGLKPVSKYRLEKMAKKQIKDNQERLL